MALANIAPGDPVDTPASAFTRWGTEALTAQKTAVSVACALGEQEHDQQHDQPDPDNPASEPGILAADAGGGTLTDGPGWLAASDKGEQAGDETANGDSGRAEASRPA